MKSLYEFQKTGTYVRVLLYMCCTFLKKVYVYVLEIPEKVLIKYFI